MIESPMRKPQRSLVLAFSVAAVLVAMGVGLWRLNSPAKTEAPQPVATGEAKAYVRNLELADVSLSASESFTNQQLVEVRGKISNHGDRTLQAVDVYCIFYSPDGQEIHRERSAILQKSAAPLKPNQTREFRLPFDALPPGWNQAVPRMVIAGIVFAS